MPSRKTLLANALCLLVLLGLYGLDLLDALHAGRAEVAAFARPPSLALPALVLVLALGASALVGWGLARRRGEDFKGYRLLPIVLVGALLMDLVRSEGGALFSSAELTAAALQELRDGAQALATERAVPSDPARLRALAEGLGQAPYLLRGQAVGPFTLQVREGCQGPALEPAGARPGTFVYCVASDRRQAWVTAVGLPQEQRFGPAAMLSVRGIPQAVRIRPNLPEEPSAQEGSFRAPPAWAPPPARAEGAESGPAP